MALTPSVGKSSVLVSQLAPPSYERHKPPAGAPAKMMSGLVG